MSSNVAFVWSFNWIGERSSCEDVVLSIFPACTHPVSMWQGKDEGGETQMDSTCLLGHIFTVKHNVSEHDFLNAWQMLQFHFCCLYLSLIFCSFGPTRQKKEKKNRENWEKLLNFPFPVLVPVNVEIFNSHNHAV